MPVAAQLKTVYLAPSETFIYGHLARLQCWRPLVFAEHLEHLDRFPLPDVTKLDRPALGRRAFFAVLRRLFRDETWRAGFVVNEAVVRALQPARLLHAHYGEAGLAALPLLRRTRLPLITSFHGRDVAKPSARLYGRWLYRPLFGAGAAFTVVSERMRAQLVALGAPTERVTVIRTGIDPEEFAFTPRAWPADGAVRMLTCGRLTEKKGTRYALEALAHLAPEYPGLRLTVIGDGPLRASLTRLADDLGLARRVDFLGAQPAARVAAELARSHLFVLPCVTAADGDQEGVPVVLMEAQAAGLPVLSSWHAGVPEVVYDGVTGYLARERDVDQVAQLLGQLLVHPERWPELGAAGRAHVLAEFDVCVAASRLERLYDSVADGPEVRHSDVTR